MTTEATIETPTVPTQDEIAARFAARRETDVLGFEVHEYLEWLDFKHAKPFLKPAAAEGEWGVDFKPLTRTEMLARMLGYMPFAWAKANDCRGISASRSVMHFVAWTWLAGDREFSDEILSMDYQNYGKEILIAICERYKWSWADWDDGARTNTGER